DASARGCGRRCGAAAARRRLLRPGDLVQRARLEELARVLGGAQQRLHLAAQLGLLGASVAQKGGALADGQLAGDVEEDADPPPLLRRHWISRWSGSSSRASGRRTAAQLAEEPGLGRVPVALDRRRRRAHHLGGLLDGEAAEEAQLDDARLVGVERLELAERVVEVDQVDARRLDAGVDVLDGEV